MHHPYDPSSILYHPTIRPLYPTALAYPYLSTLCMHPSDTHLRCRIVESYPPPSHQQVWGGREKLNKLIKGVASLEWGFIKWVERRTSLLYPTFPRTYSLLINRSLPCFIKRCLRVGLLSPPLLRTKRV